jgi:peptide deformylase
MILSIYGYGQSVLKKKAESIDADYPELEELIANMWETMYQAQGVGLAAPQVGLPIRLFIIDTEQMQEEGKESEGLKRVFINAEKVEENGEPLPYEEGCLSIPDIRGDVIRPAVLHLRYQDEHFEEHEEVFTGMTARVIQHEYDHLEGVLFIEYLKPVKKRLIRKKLENIKKGKISVDYKMKFSGQ